MNIRPRRLAESFRGKAGLLVEVGVQVGLALAGGIGVHGGFLE